MRDEEKRPTELFHKGDTLRKLLLEHPDLPLLVLATDDANSGDYCTMSCGSIYAEIGEFLDCRQEVNDERCYTDREDFFDAVYNNLDLDTYEHSDLSKDELEAMTEKEVAEYDPYWKPCIILTVGN